MTPDIEAVRPLPRFPEPDTEPFYARCREHRLSYQTCRKCGAIVFYPRSHCTRCTSTELMWHDSEGRGTIYSVTIMRQHGHPAFRARLPMAVALVDVDEGFRLLAEIVTDDPFSVHIGQPVTLAWITEGEVTLPGFTPVAES